MTARLRRHIRLRASTRLAADSSVGILRYAIRLQAGDAWHRPYGRGSARGRGLPFFHYKKRSTNTIAAVSCTTFSSVYVVVPGAQHGGAPTTGQSIRRVCPQRSMHGIAPTGSCRSPSARQHASLRIPLSESLSTLFSCGRARHLSINSPGRQRESLPPVPESVVAFLKIARTGSDNGAFSCR